MAKKRKGVVDRLSTLSDHILITILSFLDTKAAFRTSILSNRWSALWKSVPVLVFYRDQGETQHSFREWVGKVLSLRNDNCELRCLSFSFGDEDMDAVTEQPSDDEEVFSSGDEDDAVTEQERDDEELFKRVMEYAASHGLERLSIALSYGGHFPEESFNTKIVGLAANCNQSLEALEMTNFCLFDTAYSFWPGFQVLTTLTLSSCTFHPSDYSDNSIEPFSKLPCLKNLELFCCIPVVFNLVCLKIYGPQLLSLKLVEISHFRVVEVTAPKLESFSCWSHMQLLDEVPKLSIPCLDDAYLRVAPYGRADLQSQGKQCMEWFRALYNARSLRIHYDVIRILGETMVGSAQQLSPFTRLVSLDVIPPKDDEEVVPEIHHRGLWYFLKASPGWNVNVEQKIVKFRKAAPSSIPK